MIDLAHKGEYTEGGYKFLARRAFIMGCRRVRLKCSVPARLDDGTPVTISAGQEVEARTEVGCHSEKYGERIEVVSRTEGGEVAVGHAYATLHLHQ